MFYGHSTPVSAAEILCLTEISKTKNKTFHLNGKFNSTSMCVCKGNESEVCTETHKSQIKS